MPTSLVLGSARARFTISLSAAVGEPVTVDWLTKDGTAISGRDYETNGGTVVFAPGETSKDVEVFVHGRTVDVEDRVFYVVMVPPVNAILADQVGACVIHVDTTGSTPVLAIVIPKGEKGERGYSAYQIALQNGFVGTEQEWLASLKPSAADLAPEVAAIINMGESSVTAEGTEGFTPADRKKVKSMARQTAYMPAGKIAFAPVLNAGENIVPMTAFVGDAVNPRQIGFSVHVVRAGAIESIEWRFLEGSEEVAIYGAQAGDKPVAVEYGVGGFISRLSVKPSGSAPPLSLGKLAQDVADIPGYIDDTVGDRLTNLEGYVYTRVDSVAAMRALPKGQNAYLVDWHGGWNARAKPQPLGGGLFEWSPGDTGTDDGGTTIAVTADGSGRLVRVTYGEPANPFWWGALDDGSNAYAAFQSAIDWAQENGAYMRIPDGHFTISQTLFQSKPLVVAGGGMKNSTITCTVGTAWLFNPPTPSFNTGCEWRDFGLTGAQNALHIQLSAAIPGPPLKVCFMADALIHRMYLNGVEGVGLHLDNSIGNVDGIFTTTVMLCEVANGIRGSKIGDSNRMLWNKVYGRNCSIYWEGVPGARGSQIMGNNLTGTGGSWALLFAEGVEVSWNQCEHPGYASGYTGQFDSCAYVHSCFMIVVHDNVINPNNGAATAPVSPGMANQALAIDGDSTDIVVWGNDINKGVVSHINIGQSTVIGVDLERQRRFYGAAPAISDLGTDTILPTFRGSLLIAAQSIPNNNSPVFSVPVPGATLGQFAQVAFPYGMQGLEVHCWVDTPGVISVRLINRTGLTVDIAAGRIKAKSSS